MVIPPLEEDTVYEAIKEAYRSGRKDGIREYSQACADGIGATARTKGAMHPSGLPHWGHN